MNKPFNKELFDDPLNEKYRSIISSWIQPKDWSNEVFLKE